MSRVFDGNSSNYLTYTGPLGGAYQTALVWVKKTSAHATTEYIFDYVNAPGSTFRTSITPTGLVNYFAQQEFGGNRSTVGTVGLSQWVPIVFNKQANDRVHIVLGAETTEQSGFYGNTAADSGPVLYVGIRGDITSPADFKIGQLTYWSTLLSAGDITTLQGGADPTTVSNGTLIEHWPMDTADLVGTISGYTLVATGTVANDDADNPLGAAPGGDTDSRPITLSPPADTIVINAMTTGADAAVITEGSVFDSNMIAVEDNMQSSIPLQIAVTGGFADMTLEANGVYGFSYSGGAVDQAFDIDVTYYSPSTGQMSLATITTIPA